MTEERRVIGDLGAGPEMGARRKTGGGRGARKGNFAQMYRGPDKPSSIDWDKLRSYYYAVMRRQVERGVDNRETRMWRDNGLHLMPDHEVAKFLDARARARLGSGKLQGSSLTPEDRARGGRSSTARKANVPEIVRLYVEENMKPDDIATDQGIRVETVREWLKRRGVWERHKHQKTKPEGSGKQGSHVCPKGHYKEPGKQCLTCHAEYQREYSRARRQNRGWS